MRYFWSTAVILILATVLFYAFSDQSSPSKLELNEKYAKPFSTMPSVEYAKEQDRLFNENGVVPEYIRTFAETMAEEMLFAKRSSRNASISFNKFVTCIKAPSEYNVDTIKAMCAENAYELSAIYPDILEELYQNVEKSLSANVKKLMRKTI